ncbi:MAG: 16S rRNA (adenine(1518)-N(6)/adenine(1519)-N(6))-dimethyltransferase RsmA [Helicobacteraceae bacterium]|nr:16S rRNA (adenine(1518)-N(6)/adenine(1519)-N(6))-dimethyltransferase RsmA [Helicobacteraceae bacterium]
MVRAKKRFGQNFLADQTIVSKIIEATSDLSFEIVEIGPGLGDLTEAILARGNLSAIEIDGDLIAILKKRFAAAITRGELTLINADALEAWKTGLSSKPYAIIANLPYYAATEIILRALRDPLCREIVVMAQLEVAQKFCGANGANSLSLLVQSIGSAELLFKVPKEAFKPAPKVESAVIKIVKTKPSYDEGFSNFLKEAFRAPRKRLTNNIKAPIETLKSIGANENTRASELRLEQFETLYKGIKSGSGNA